MLSAFRDIFILSLNYSTRRRLNVNLKSLRVWYLSANRLVSTITQTNENSFARQVLESSPLYKDLVIQSHDEKNLENNISVETLLQNTNFSSIQVDELCDTFVKMSASPSISIMDSSCISLRNSLKEHSHSFSDEQIAALLKSLACWPVEFSSKSSFYYDLCIEFDKVCVARWRSWNLCKVFYFLDLWYGLQIAKYSTFFYKASSRLVHNPHKLSPQQVVQLLFYLNLLRTATKNAKTFELEYRLTEVADKLTLDELGVAVMGFFKADKALSNIKLMEHLIDRVISEIKKVPDITLTSIMKALRRSITTTLWPKLESMLDPISEELPRLSIQSNIHAALLVTKPQLLHEPLLNTASQKVVQNLTQCRLKDMEKTIFPLVQLVYDPPVTPCIFKSILEELDRPERSKEIEEYPKSFIAIIHYCCIKGIYPEKFIQKILDMDFIKTVYGKHKFNFGREVLCIDTAIELDYPSYSGPRLPPEIRNYLSKRYSEYLPDSTRKLTRHQALHLDIIQTAENLFGKENVAVKYLIPSNPKADIIVHLDENFKPIPLPDSLRNAEDFTGPLRAPDSNYFVLIVGSKNLYLYKSNKLNGETTCKIKQLKLLGYTPRMVLCENWPKGNTLEKMQHLRNLLFAVEGEEL